MLGSVARVRPPRPRGVLGTSPSQQEKVSKISTEAVPSEGHVTAPVDEAPRSAPSPPQARARSPRGPRRPTRCSRSRRRAASTRPRAPPRADASRGSSGDRLRASPGRHRRAIQTRVVRSSRSRRARARRTTSTARGPQSARLWRASPRAPPRGTKERARHAGPRVSGWSACARHPSSFRASSSDRLYRRAPLTTRFWRLCRRNKRATKWKAVLCRRV